MRVGLRLGPRKFLEHAFFQIEEILGQRLRSNVIRSGPVIHTESHPEKEPGRAAAPT